MLPGSLLRLIESAGSSTIGRRVLHGFSWAMVGAVTAKMFAIVSSVFIARALGGESYGELGIIQSTVGIFQLFAGFSLGLTASKHVAQYRHHDPQRAGEIIVLSSCVAIVTGGLVALVFLFAGPWLAAHTIAAPHLADLLAIGGLLLFLGALNGAQVGALSGFEAFKEQAQLTVFNGFSSLLFLITGVLVAGLRGVVWAMVIVSVLNWLATHLMLRKVMTNAGVQFHFSGAQRNIKVLKRFSLPAVLMALLVTPINWACNVLLINQPGGYVQMGIYNAALQWYNTVMFIPLALGKVLNSIFAERLGANDTQGVKKILAETTKIILPIALTVLIFASIFSDTIMGLYGDEFRSGTSALVVLLLTACLYAATIPFWQAITASGNMWAGLAINAVWACILLVVTYLLIDMGALGLGIARFTAYLVYAVIVYVYVSKRISMTSRSIDSF